MAESLSGQGPVILRGSFHSGKNVKSCLHWVAFDGPLMIDPSANDDTARAEWCSGKWGILGCLRRYLGFHKTIADVLHYNLRRTRIGRAASLKLSKGSAFAPTCGIEYPSKPLHTRWGAMTQHAIVFECMKIRTGVSMYPLPPCF